MMGWLESEWLVMTGYIQSDWLTVIDKSDVIGLSLFKEQQHVICWLHYPIRKNCLGFVIVNVFFCCSLYD